MNANPSTPSASVTPGETTEIARFTSSALPTNPVKAAFITWCVGTFLLHSLGVVIFGRRSMFATGIPLLLGIGIALLVRWWPRPRMVHYLNIAAEGLSGNDHGGKPFYMATRDLELVAAEGNFQWHTWKMNPWKRLNFRAGAAWFAIQLQPERSMECYRAVLDRFPHVLGISGECQLDLPAIEDAAAFQEWLARVRRLCRQELSRQFFLYLIYAVFLMSGGLAFLMPTILGFVRHHALAGGGPIHFAIGGSFALLGGCAFIIAAVRRRILISRILADLVRHTQSDYQRL